jgi:hypothetical protein
MDMWHMSRALSDRDLDMLLFPTIYSYVPVLTRAKKLLMIHDIIPEKFPQLTLPGRKGRYFWQLKSALGRWQADAVITVSDYSKQCITVVFNIPSDRVYVVGDASDPIFQVIENPKLPPKLAALIISQRRLVA